MNKNTFEGIQYFIELAKLGSITLVTKSLNVDHKTIKQKVQLLEKTLNKKLIDSSHQGTSLTTEGWKFHQEISQAYASFSNKVDNNHNDKNSTLKSTINLLLPPATGLLFTQHILPHTYKKYPELNINITTFDIWYLLSYGSHIKSLLNNFNIMMIDDFTMQLINPDEWLLSNTSANKQQLYAHKDYISEQNISEIEDLTNSNFISRSGTLEESGLIRLENMGDKTIKTVQFSNNITARNDLIKAHLVNQGLGIALLEPMIFECGQNLDLVKIFPKYEYAHRYNYNLLYRPHDIHKKYIKSIVDVGKAYMKDKLFSF